MRPIFVPLAPGVRPSGRLAGDCRRVQGLEAAGDVRERIATGAALLHPVPEPEDAAIGVRVDPVESAPKPGGDSAALEGLGNRPTCSER